MYKIVLLRHGQSTWNLENRFTGWWDVDLSPAGEAEASAAGRPWIPVRRHWRLNERHYGALTGLDKGETLERYGPEQFTAWRRSYATPPPPMQPDSPWSVLHDPRYAGLPPSVLPATECLADVVARMLPYWEDAVAGDLLAGRTVLVAAHGNSLRGLIKHLDGIGDDAIAGVEIPTGVPIVYTFDAGLRPVSKQTLGEP